MTLNHEISINIDLRHSQGPYVNTFLRYSLCIYMLMRHDLYTNKYILNIEIFLVLVLKNKSYSITPTSSL